VLPYLAPLVCTDPNTIAFLKQMVVDYKAAAGVDIQLETVPVLETWIKVTTAIKAGKPYDFITFGQITEPLLLAKDNLLIPLTSIIKEVGEKDFGPRALDWYRNELWMYPYDYNFNYLISLTFPFHDLSLYSCDILLSTP
jgi:multiple sugar transport system substrate-binding protein